MLITSQHLMVFAPHPDDEVLGAGGLIAKSADAGSLITVVIYRMSGQTRAAELDACLDILAPAAHKTIELTEDGTPPLTLNQWDLTATVDAILKVQQPDLVVGPPPHAYHAEHRHINAAIMSACRPNGATDRWRPPALAFYEQVADQWGHDHGGFRPNWYVTLNGLQAQRKLAGYACHASQVRDAPSERSPAAVDALMRMRGALCGSTFAEAYVAMYLRS